MESTSFAEFVRKLASRATIRRALERVKPLISKYVGEIEKYQDWILAVAIVKS
jgi:hypothetical protein